MPKRIAVVLFNLGGPDSLDAVQPFLFNLFYDPAIIRLPNPLRFLLAKIISSRRVRTAQHIYAQMGGKSPIFEQTQAQAKALEAALGEGFKCFIAMRYWHPRAQETLQHVRAYQPDRIVLLPLYPQYSTTTTASSLAEWHALGCEIPTAEVHSYPVASGLIAAQAELIRAAYIPGARILFSAHGLPEKIVAAGDPYPLQVEQTVAAVVKKLNIPGLDYVLCYQSRVGPLKWIGPATEEEIKRAGAQKKSLLVVPIAFVSEHSETLVELDIEYRALAKECGVPHYARVPAVGTHPLFIDTLAQLCRNAAHVG